MPSTSSTPVHRGARSATRAPAAPEGQRADIQALRALAVLLVVVYHLWPGRLGGGFVGVDVFFVISGFLITARLVREAERSGRVRLGQFWARRVHRLLPASLVVVVATCLATIAWVPDNRWKQFFDQALGSTFYVQNWVLSHAATDYSASGEAPSAFQHFWSLSVEEQFYVALPLVVLLSLAIGRSWRRALVGLTVLVTVASLAWSVLLTHDDPAAAYFVTTTRTWELGVGALLALLGARHLHRVPPATAWVGTGMILVSAWLYDGSTPFPGAAAVLPVAGAALVLATVRHDRAYDAITGWTPVQWVGDASYSIYLWHWPLYVLAPFVLGHGLGLTERLVILGLSLGAGHLSLVLVERPLRITGPREARWSDPSLAVVGVLLLAAVLSALAGHRQLDAHQAEAREVERSLRADTRCFGAAALHHDCPAPQVVVPALSLYPDDFIDDSACWSSYDEPPAYGACSFGPERGARLRVAVVGDSHSNALIPMYERMAEQQHWRIDVRGRAGCYPLDVRLRGAPSFSEPCLEWGEQVQRIVERGRYDLVIVTHSERSRAGVADDRQGRYDATVAALRRSWKGFTDSGAAVVALQDVPRIKQPTLGCVEREDVAALLACAVPRRGLFVDGDDTQRAASRGVDGVSYVPTADLLCREDECPLVIGGVRVYRNAVHLTRTYSITLAPYVGPRIERAVAASR